MSSNVTICVPYRDATGYLDRSIEQICTLDYPPSQLRIITVEGDSIDGTADRLRRWADDDSRVTALTCTTGAPRYPSIVHAGRFAVLSRVFNTALEWVDTDWSTHILFMPGDIWYERNVLRRLLDQDRDMIAPMFWRHRGADPLFYDIWAFTNRDGQEFAPFAMSYARANLPDRPFEVETVGGMVLLRARFVALGCRYTETEVDRGLCRSVRAIGGTVWADPTTHIYHA